MPMSARALTAALEDKFGFVASQGRHEKYRLTVEGTYVAHTQVSHGWGEISNTMLAKIARQLGVTSQELRLMVDCSIDREGYLRMVW
jgi:DNA-binding IclR family transcriptional regulator